MNSIKLRSARDPEFWLPIVLSLAVLVPLMIGTHAWTSEFIARMKDLGSTDPGAALLKTTYVLRRATWLMCALLIAFSVYFYRYCQLGRREGRLPPSGWWSYGSLRAMVGRRVERVGKGGQWVAGILLVASIGMVITVEHLLRLLETGELVL